MYQLIVFDCDGTLLNDAGEVLPKTREEIARVVRSGVDISVASGRAGSGIRKVLKQIGLEEDCRFLIGFNGALIADTKAGRTLQNKCLHAEDFVYAAAMAKEYGCFAYMISEEAACGFEESEEMKIEAGKNDLPVRICLNGEGFKSFVPSKIVIAGDSDGLDCLVREKGNALREKFSIMRSAKNNLDLIHPEASKGEALKTICRIEGIDLSRVIAFGDAENDIEILSLAGLGVAMKNSLPRVKEIADRITDTNNEEGIAKVLAQIFPPGEQ